jgi:hypothetical protein
MLDLIRNADVLTHTDTVKYGLAAVGLGAFVGFYYLGEYLFSDREPGCEIASRSD